MHGVITQSSALQVASQDGGIRLTRLEQPTTSRRAPVASTAEQRPGRLKERVPTLSSLQLNEGAQAATLQ